MRDYIYEKNEGRIIERMQELENEIAEVVEKHGFSFDYDEFESAFYQLTDQAIDHIIEKEEDRKVQERIDAIEESRF